MNYDTIYLNNVETSYILNEECSLDTRELFSAYIERVSFMEYTIVEHNNRYNLCTCTENT